jgi:SAM-dependent methyltransferase
VSLFGGSADYYATGRMPYPPALADAFELDGNERLLDVGCGPGSLTILLAPHVREAVGIDADGEMIAAAPPVPNVGWVQMRAEELPGDLGRFDLVTFAQSFHWMDQARVARAVRAMADSLVLVSATTHRGDDGTDPLPHPRPPHDDITALIHRYVGPPERAGTPWEDDTLREAGFTRSRQVEIDAGGVVTRTADEIVAVTFSLSYANPRRFAERRAEFEAELRDLLKGGPFSERRRAIGLDFWT